MKKGMQKYLVLSSLMLASLVVATPVLADDYTQSGSTTPTTTVNLTVAQKYKVRIPAEVTLTYNNDADQKGKYTTADTAIPQIYGGDELKIANGKKVQVKIASGEDFKITSGESAEFTYTVQKGSSGGDTVLANGVFLEAAAATGTDTQQALYFETVAITKSGTYQGTLNFEISVV